MMKHRTNPQAGFTILELMIATTVLSVILLFVSIMMINLGNLYYKGISQIRIQNTVRNLSDDVRRNLQLTSNEATSQVGGAMRAYCIGTTRYVYRLDSKLGSDESVQVTADPSIGRAAGSLTYKHVLWKDNVTEGACAVPSEAEFNTFSGQLPGGTDGTELMAPNSRLTAFNISSESPYSLEIGVAYGDADLLSGSGINTLCTGGSGQQFCATAKQKTTIARRITP